MPRPCSFVLLFLLLFPLILPVLAHPPATSPTLLERALLTPATPAPSHAPSPPAPFASDLHARATALHTRRHHAAALRLYRVAALLGHSAAATAAASLLLVHEPLRDVGAAVRLLRMASSRGHAAAHSQLGLLHASGLAERYGVPKSEAAALLHWRVAAGAGEPYANAALGWRYRSGWGVRKDCDEAARFYKVPAQSVATDARFWPTARHFMYGEPPLAARLRMEGRTRFAEDMFDGGGGRHVNEGDDLDVYHYHRHMAEAGDATEMTMIGSLLLVGGMGVDPDPVLAREHLTRAAAQMHGEAHGILGHLALKAGDFMTALDHFRRSAGAENRIGHYALGMIYLEGLGGMEKDFSKAAMHFTLAAEREHADASFQLAMLMWRGLGVEKDLSRAFSHFKDSARLGNIQSKLNVATIMLQGVLPASKRDCERAVGLFKEVAEQGEWNLFFDLALGAFDRGDIFGSVFRHVKAAHAGIELGQYNAATTLEMADQGEIAELEHWDVDRLAEEMHELYAMSGLQGTNDAYIRSANVAYTEEERYELALEVYQKAAGQGSAEGLFSLATMHANGVGTPVNREKAREYLQLVGKKGPVPEVAATLATAGFTVWWGLQDAWVWWLRMSEPSGVAMDEDGEGRESQKQLQENPGRNGGIRMGGETRIWSVRSIGDDVAIVGGLLVILIAVLVLRGKRLSRQGTPGEAAAS